MLVEAVGGGCGWMDVEDCCCGLMWLKSVDGKKVRKRKER